MTRKLYDENSYATEFDAVVIKCEKADNGYKIELDQTLFFPEEGGQSSDVGTIGSANITLAEISAGAIYHISDVPLCEGETVHGKIDFAHRFRNMQNHSGEHIICGIAHSIFGYDNVGFHLGDDIVTMDLSGELTDDDIALLEQKANEAVVANHEVSAWYPSAEEIKMLDYRSKLDITENVRLVKIGDVDLCACCAPHVKRTGEIGIVKILDAMRHRGGMRLSILCGFDALRDYQRRHKEILCISNLLSVKQNECADGVKKLLSDMANLKAELWEKSKQLVLSQIDGIEETQKAICLFCTDANSDCLRLAANKLKDKTSSLAVALSGTDEEGYSFVMAIDEGEISQMVKEATSVLNGRGGGKGTMASGRFGATKEEIEAYFDKI